MPSHRRDDSPPVPPPPPRRLPTHLLPRPARPAIHVRRSLLTLATLAVVGVVGATTSTRYEPPLVEVAAETGAPLTGKLDLLPPPVTTTPVEVGDDTTVVAAIGGVFTPSSVAAVDQIPAPALVAYQRAETVIGRASEECRLDWTVLAAIGHVETGHGTRDGGSLDDNGLAQPAIYSEPFDGEEGRPRVADTDGGSLDGDLGYDRGMGPMMLSPSAWTTLGVDGDADGSRDVQDVDDAALAVAVFLCSDGTDLSDAAALATRLAAYDATPGFADRVAEAAAGYAADPAPDTDVVTVSDDDTDDTETPDVEQTSADDPPVLTRPGRPADDADDAEEPAEDTGRGPGNVVGHEDLDEPTVPTKPTKPTKPEPPVCDPEDIIVATPEEPLEPTEGDTDGDGFPDECDPDPEVPEDPAAYDEDAEQDPTPPAPPARTPETQPAS